MRVFLIAAILLQIHGMDRATDAKDARRKTSFVPSSKFEKSEVIHREDEYWFKTFCIDSKPQVSDFKSRSTCFVYFLVLGDFERFVNLHERVLKLEGGNVSNGEYAFIKAMLGLSLWKNSASSIEISGLLRRSRHGKLPHESEGSAEYEHYAMHRGIFERFVKEQDRAMRVEVEEAIHAWEAEAYNPLLSRDAFEGKTEELLNLAIRYGTAMRLIDGPGVHSDWKAEVERVLSVVEAYTTPLDLSSKSSELMGRNSMSKEIETVPSSNDSEASKDSEASETGEGHGDKQRSRSFRGIEPEYGRGSMASECDSICSDKSVFANNSIAGSMKTLKALLSPKKFRFVIERGREESVVVSEPVVLSGLESRGVRETADDEQELPNL